MNNPAKTIPPLVAHRVTSLIDRLLDLARGNQPYLTPSVSHEVGEVLRASGRPVGPVRTLFRAVELLLDVERRTDVRHGYGMATTWPPASATVPPA